MRQQLSWAAAGAAALALSAACGGGGDGGIGPGGGGNGAVTAKIDGVAWSANDVRITSGSTGVPGSIVVTATRIDGNASTGIQFILGFVKFQANYPLGVNFNTTPGGTASVTETSPNSQQARMTPLDGASGVFQVVSRSGNHISGVFNFVAQPIPGQSVTGNRVVTEGTFDFDLPSGFTDLGTTNYGSDVGATLGGNPFYGATVIGIGQNGVFSIGGQTTKTSLNILNTTPLTSAGTLNLLAGVKITVIDVTTGHSWGGISGDVGSVSFSGVSGGRAVGTFSGTLAANSPGDSPLTITNGFFNVRVDTP